MKFLKAVSESRWPTPSWAPPKKRNNVMKECRPTYIVFAANGNNGSGFRWPYSWPQRSVNPAIFRGDFPDNLVIYAALFLEPQISGFTIKHSWLLIRPVYKPFETASALILFGHTISTDAFPTCVAHFVAKRCSRQGAPEKAFFRTRSWFRH